MNPIAMAYGALFFAIVLETVGTLALQASHQFTRLGPTVVMIAAYLASFYFLTLALRAVPLGIAYATWGGVGIILISIFGYVVFDQKLDWPAIFGIALIVAGVVLVNGFSRATPH
ncbi:MAG: DMT family transporter [Methyloligella sp. ZOD6]